MKKLRRPRWLSLSTVTMAMALISALPAGALAETPGSTESSPPAEAGPPTSTGWVPQDETAEDTGDAAPPIRRGSSLGSGGSSQSPPPEEEPAPTEEPAIAPAPSGSYEPEASSPSTFEEPAVAPRAVPTVEAEPRPSPSATVAVGAPKPVAEATPPQHPSRPAPPVEATPAADTSGPAAAGPGGLLWPTLIVGFLILLYAGARLLLGPVELDIFRSSPFRRVRRGYPRA